MSYFAQQRQALALPEIFDRIWHEQANELPSGSFQSPAAMAALLQQHSDAFCHGAQLLPLWQINGSALVGYLTESQQYICWHYEDGPEHYQILGDDYSALLAYIFRSLLITNKRSQLEQFARLFQLLDLDALIDYSEHNRDWEEGIFAFLKSSMAN